VTVPSGSLFIGGEWIDSTGTITDIVNPTTEQVIAAAPDGSEADVAAAVLAARQAFDDPSGWGSWTTAARNELLIRFADALEERSADLVHAVSSQNGMPIAIGQASEGVVGPLAIRYFAGVASATESQELRPRLGGGSTVISREPIGVVAAVVPWNFPLSLAFFKIAPALAAGCTVVWKPSPETVLDAMVVAETAQKAGLPPGVLNVVPGGRETGAALVQHPGVDKVAFTGSTAAGRSIGEICGRLLRPVSLELGGKSAAIVLDDVALETHFADLFAACFLNTGQTCYLSTRVLVPRQRYAEIVDGFADLARSLAVGDPLDPRTQIGPVVTAGQRERVEGFISRAAADGARTVVGGRRPAGIDTGWFVEPTVFADVDPSSELAREEVFGPVLALTPYETVDDAVAMANDSAYGLAGSVWTEDQDRGMDVARRVRTGTFGINGFRIDLGSPFGGIKSSGLGRELGPEGLAAYQQVKTIYATFS